ncbi:Butirosin biosynthesis protein H, N-terminal [Madurella fahalii]|uniref:Butirosin biosynthesis protein H, N-terminal n=1 Tax=Madurella fahalii TaxID=1157608 RepID=A0ABQ0FYW5_9PEZI
MDHITYTGSGPYCYANSLAMMLGKAAPSPAVIEFATSSPFGMHLVGGRLPFFDPYGWDPSKALDACLGAAGWTSILVVGRDADDALAQLRQALEKGPVFVGPVDMGHLRYHPDSNSLRGADHYLVVLQVLDGWVELHDPHGFPHATLPLGDFMAAWKAASIAYGEPYMMRTGFRRVEEVSEEDVIRRSLAHGRRWLSMDNAHDMPPGSVGNGMAAEQLATLIQTQYDAELRGHLVHFAVRVGARRVADAATCLSRVGYDEAACVMAKQARLIGSLQYSLVEGDIQTATETLRTLAGTYEQLRIALEDR